MSVMGHEWAYECPDCGRIGQHAKTCGMFPLGIVDAGNRVEVVRAADHQGAVKELRALFEEADYQAQREYPTPERLREALLRADAWLTANGGQ
jgi:acetylornithine/succinyldiaminopimelate/putrescine aminotransferase